MSKDCKECDFFNGWDYSDGTPCCDCEGGYECCPFNDSANVSKKGLNIIIDSAFMSDYIRHTLVNTIESQSHSIAKEYIKDIVTAELKEKVIKEMDSQISRVVSAEIDKFMQGEITIGGGWGEPTQKLTRNEYLSKTVQETLEHSVGNSSIKSYAENEVKKSIDKYTEQIRKDINVGIKQYFDTATRDVLTNNVVSMLMCSDTYKNLSNAMNNFLPESK